MYRTQYISWFSSKKLALCLFFIVLSISLLPAQEREDKAVSETTKDTGHVHSPKLAMYMSAVLPGAGQVYNKRYWYFKVPAIYIAGGLALYSTFYHSDRYHIFKNAYNSKYRDANFELVGYEGYTLEQYKSIKDQYRRYRDLSVIGLVLVYVYNVLDAVVYGYLFDFDVSDDLSLRLEPAVLPNIQHRLPQRTMASQWQAQTQVGFKCTLSF